MSKPVISMLETLRVLDAEDSVHSNARDGTMIKLYVHMRVYHSGHVDLFLMKQVQFSACRDSEEATPLPAYL